MKYPDVSDPREGLCVLPIDTVDLGAAAFAGADVIVPEQAGAAQSETSRFGWQQLRELGAAVVVPMVERLQGAEGKVQNLIERTERIIIGTYDRAPLPVRKSRSCGLVSDVFR